MSLGQRLAALDAVTIDAYGTLFELDDPVGRLRKALAAHGVRRAHTAVEAAFAAEVEHYARARRTVTDLEELWLECAGVFLQAADARLEPAAFVNTFNEAYVFRPIPGALETVERLAAHGLALALVANWDAGLRSLLVRHALEGHFASIVIAGETGVWKPDPAAFRLALAELGVPASRALHVGDDRSDREGAAAAGLRFAPAPLAGLG